MNSKLGVLLFSSALVLTISAHPTECKKTPAPAPRMVEFEPQVSIVTGELRDFDPCNSSVELRFPRDISKPPLFIITHGGSGLSDAEKNLANELRKMGFATRVFDAFKMNGFDRDWRYWAEKVSNESRQRMLYRVTFSAYEWAISQEKINSTKIYFHGVSNGANTVVNIAGAVDSARVKGVFAEGTMMSGIGVPDKLNVPVRLIFGKLDNYGGKREDEWRWLLKELCIFNGRTHRFIQPKGSSQRCNMDNNPKDMTESPMEWFEKQRKSGADIDIWWYDGAAHGMFLGVVTRQTRTWGVNEIRYAWTGGSEESRKKFLEDLKNFTN